VPLSASGLRYDEPAIGISWPQEPSVISERDLGWPAWRGMEPSPVRKAEI
jgi:dTDP-4-dehydrorhamnose 3,5-epimerase